VPRTLFNEDTLNLGTLPHSIPVAEIPETYVLTTLGKMSYGNEKSGEIWVPNWGTLMNHKLISMINHNDA
jgi:hypothetical protein